jgi:hypothetical protein
VQLPKTKLVLAALLLGAVSTSFAQSGPYKWALSPALGLQAPQIKGLNDKALKAPLLGTGEVCPTTSCGDTTPSQTIYLANFPEPIGASANAGLELQWVQSERHVFLMGASTWDGSTESSIPAQLPVQQKLRNVDYIRRDKLSYNEFYFGWKYSLFSVPNKYRFYSRISLNEIFDISFREEHIFNIHEPKDSVNGDLDGVSRIFVGKGKTTGVLMGQFGFGGEYFLKKNISINGEWSYLLSERFFNFRDTSRDSNFAAGDHVVLVPSVRPSAQGQPLGYLPPDFDSSRDLTKETAGPDGVPVTNMNLRFDGWKLLFRLTIYY